MSSNSTESIDPAEAAETVSVPWSVVWVTLVVSGVLGIIFYAFFIVTRNKHQEQGKLDLYEQRLLTQASRSPSAFQGGSWLGWAKEAYSISDDDAVRCMGLDCFMFTRLLRLGFRISAFGTACSVILMIVYVTGNATGPATEEFNVITIASVEDSSPRLWATALLFAAFVAFVLKSIYEEWRDTYAPLRSLFLATGDASTPTDYRYSVIMECVPEELRSNQKLHEYLEILFPKQVRSVYVVQNTSALEKLVQERQAKIEALEKAVAFSKAKPSKPAPQVKQNPKLFGLLGGEKVDAVSFLTAEIDRLNVEIDRMRAEYHRLIDLSSKGSRDPQPEAEQAEVSIAKTKFVSNEDQNSLTSHPMPTAFVTFSSLRAKQAAVQCELSGKVDNLDCANAPIPNSIIWKNVGVPVTLQRHSSMLAAAFWIFGALFWAVPVAFVMGLANLKSLLATLKLPPMNSESFAYGLLSGVLPVVFLQILMIVLYLSIECCAKYFIRSKCMPEVDAYTFFWHQIYQFANLWLILIGGSAINQLDAVLEDPTSLINLLAKALPGASTFFVNNIIMSSFLAFGLELSRFVPFAVDLVIGVISPEPMQTQRALDTKKKPPSIVWGKALPPIVFIFLVVLAYMPIVPIMEAFAMVYFGGWYLIWKHNCLHVYAQEFEGGGLIWETLSGFFMVCLYMAEVILCAYLGLKISPGPAIFTAIVTLGGTLVTHFQLRRNIAGPLKNLSLEIAARIDHDQGELPLSDDDMAPSSVAVENLLYAQPCLSSRNEERSPMPYRREQDEEGQQVNTSLSDELSEGQRVSTEVVLGRDPVSSNPSNRFI